MENMTDTKMDFSDCLRYLKNQYLMARQDWLGTGKFIFYVAGFRVESASTTLTEIYPPASQIEYKPQIFLNNTNGQVEQWSASTSDICAADWQIIGDQVANNTPSN